MNRMLHTKVYFLRQHSQEQQYPEAKCNDEMRDCQFEQPPQV